LEKAYHLDYISFSLFVFSLRFPSKGLETLHLPSALKIFEIPLNCLSIPSLDLILLHPYCHQASHPSPLPSTQATLPPTP